MINLTHKNMQNKILLTRIVGSFTPAMREILKIMRPGDPLQLQREPENKFDTNAIAVYALIPANTETPKMIGYVPRDHAAMLRHAELVSAMSHYKSKTAIEITYKEMQQ